MKKHLHIVIFFAALFSIALPREAAAGDGGYVTLVNGTAYDWIRYRHNQDDMERWDFPERVMAGSTVRVYIEFDALYYSDSAKSGYRFEGTTDKFDIYVEETRREKNLQVWFLLNSPNTITGQRQELGFIHNGDVNLIVVGDHDNNYLTSIASLAMDWMTRGLRWIGDLPLSKLAIPGSHDAGMSEIDGKTLLASECNTLTQTKNIYEQLRFGARYFDIRPVIGNAGKYLTGHYGYTGIEFGWQGSNGQTIDEIVDNINAFTASHNELIILHLTHARNTNAGYRRFDRGEWETLFAKLAGINHRYIETDPGKIEHLLDLTLNELISSQPQVIILVGGEDCDPTDIILPDTSPYYGQGFFSHKSFAISNDYADSNDWSTMKTDQVNKLWDLSPSHYFLFSWTLTQNTAQAGSCSLGFSASIKDLARTANPHLPYELYMHSFPGGSQTYVPNIIYTDLVTDNNSAMLALATNSRYVWRSHTLTYTAGPGGSISGTNPQTFVGHGTNGTKVIAQPDTGYHFVQWSDDWPTAARTEPNVTDSGTATATFAINSYNVTTAAGANGSISPSEPQAVNYGSTPSFSISPAENYHIDTVTGCGGNLNGNTYTTGAISSACTVEATFDIYTHTVTPSVADGGGSISPDSLQSSLQGEHLDFTLSPEIGHHIGYMSGTCDGTRNGSTFTTDPLNADCTVIAHFVLDTKEINATADEHGAVTPSGTLYPYYGDILSFTVTPEKGYRIDTVTGCNGTLTGETYTTDPIIAPCAVTVTFKRDSSWLYLILPAIIYQGQQQGLKHSGTDRDFGANDQW